MLFQDRSILGQNDKVLEYSLQADPQSRFKQTDAGLEISVMRAQRIYNNGAWPNTVVVKLDRVVQVNVAQR
jgi:alpha-L-fucosidase